MVHGAAIYLGRYYSNEWGGREQSLQTKKLSLNSKIIMWAAGVDLGLVTSVHWECFINYQQMFLYH